LRDSMLDVRASLYNTDRDSAHRLGGRRIHLECQPLDRRALSSSDGGLIVSGA